ncbi:hypothetical protein MFLAVUS_003131 [Mucor flavus]|uniref:Uncharacterized protein n=1 Tax=Mucor flavus TaxID=439312 RepID=A0ABP9YS92_9FUNG
MGWRAVMLQPHNIAHVKSHFNNVNHSQYFKYSHFTTELAFKDVKNCKEFYKFSKLELLELLNRLPSLKKINFGETNYPEEYFEYLLDADMQHINEINTGAKFLNIRSDVVFSVYYKFRNSITVIGLFYDRNAINFDSQQINIINSLTQFKKLTTLILWNNYDTNLTPFQIQDNCSNLTHLGFVSDHPISESATRRVLDNNRRINLNFISSMAYFYLRLPSLSATYTRYLVDYFPNHLKYLTIISHQNILKWFDIVGMELALRLMEKTGRIKETTIAFGEREEY